MPPWSANARNHGSDCGHVLTGIQSGRPEDLEAHLAAMGYGYSEEIGSSVCRGFLTTARAETKQPG